MTIKAAQKRLQHLGMVLRNNEREFRVNFHGGEESTAYYTDDIDDAVSTGRQMARDREPGGNGIEHDADHGGYY